MHKNLEYGGEVFKKKQAANRERFYHEPPELYVGDVVTVKGSNGYEKRFVVVQKGSLDVGYEGRRFMTDSDHRLELVRLNDWTLRDSVPLEQQVGDDSAADSAADDA